MAFAFKYYLSRIYSGLGAGERFVCYHCAENVSKKRLVMIDFDGAMRPLCCHGCYSILKTIARNGLTAHYLLQKSAERDSSILTPE